jgi:polyhydroxybutyrate depolymerase
MQIHGTSDATVPYEGTTGNGGMASVDSVINYWVAANNCNSTPTVTALPDINTNDGSTVEHFVYAGGNAGVHVELLKITNGTHTWPGNLGANRDINAGLEIWKFFSKYSNTAVSTKTIIKQNFKIYPNPTSDYVVVDFSAIKNVSYRLQTITGLTVNKGKLTDSQAKISLAHLPSGFYILFLNDQAFKIRKD